MEKKIFETRLEMLLLNKAFNTLSDDEKKYALSLLTEEEYHEYSLLLTNYKPALLTDENKIQPSPQVLATLTDAFRAQNSPKATLVGFTRNNRLLMAAATVIILIGCVVILLRADKKEQPLVAQINKPHPVINDVNPSKHPSLDLAPAKNPARNSGKKRLPFNIITIDSDLCKDIPIILDASIAIDSLDDIPCLDPMYTAFVPPDVDEQEDSQ